MRTTLAESDASLRSLSSAQRKTLWKIAQREIPWRSGWLCWMALLACAWSGSACSSVAEPIPEPVSDAGPPAVITDGGGGVEAPPDGAALCGAGDCNYQTQTGCSDGLACRPKLEGDQAVARCEAAGSAAVGSGCKQSTDCGAGALCAEGYCRAVCCGGDWSACPSDQSCIRQLELGLARGGSTPAGVDLCFPVGTCDVLDLTSCQDEPGRSCQLVDPRGSEACAPSGAVPSGGACDDQHSCSAGHSCVGGRCALLCRAEAIDAGDARPCPDLEQTCVHFDRDPAGVGECTGWK